MIVDRELIEELAKRLPEDIVKELKSADAVVVTRNPVEVCVAPNEGVVKCVYGDCIRYFLVPVKPGATKVLKILTPLKPVYPAEADKECVRPTSHDKIAVMLKAVEGKKTYIVYVPG